MSVLSISGTTSLKNATCAIVIGICPSANHLDLRRQGLSIDHIRDPP
jgi:hypothetical protein